MFFPTMVAGPIKRYEDFLPKLRLAEAGAIDLEIGITRILVGLVKKFAVADLMTAFTVHLNRADIAIDRIAVLQDLRSDVGDGDRLAEVFASANRWRDSLKH